MNIPEKYINKYINVLGVILKIISCLMAYLALEK